MDPTPSGMTIDAYLQWAMRPGVRLFDPRKSDRAMLLVQFGEPLDDDSYRRLIGSGIWCSEYFKGYAHVSVTVPIASLPGELKTLESLGAVYCELGSSNAPRFYDAPPEPPEPQPGPEVVIGIIDDGCPFAHRAYRPGNGPCVHYLWDQGGTPGTGEVPGTPFPSRYGAVYTTQLSEALQKATDSHGEVDEDHAYELLSLPSLRCIVSHGAQVMSHAAGCTRPIDHRPAPPPFCDPTGIAFVQLRPKALDDPTGDWIDCDGIDSDGMEALHAICDYARTMITPPAKKVLINLSYGPQTGPHDGSSFAERHIRELTEKAKAEGYILRVVLPSGNNHLLQAHAEFDLRKLGAKGQSIDWHVAADSRANSMLEIWLPSPITTQDVTVRVQAPGGGALAEASTITGQSPDGAIHVMTVPDATPSGQFRIAIIVAPTARAATDSALATPADPLATPGRWRVSIEPVPGRNLIASLLHDGVAHVYLQRGDPNMGRPQRGRSGYLRSPCYDDKVGALPSEQLQTDPPGTGPAEVFARGCLSGIATGAKSLVAGGYRLRDNLPAGSNGAVVVNGARRDSLPAPYSSGGPGRAGCQRGGPDWAYPTEESRVLNGMLGRGNRSGISMRFSGTSIAAPQLVRELAATPGDDFPDPVAVAPPPRPEWFALRFGKGTR
jgi:hypothetical protein